MARGQCEMIEAGETAPDFELETDTGKRLRLSDFRGKPVILYFYPRDDTPGCTKEACGIRDSWGEFERRGAVVLGVSPDSVASHQRFKSKYHLPFTLLADSEHEVAERYGAWKPKRIAGKSFLGIVRSTFLIDVDGKVAKVWPKVDPAKHADWLLAELPD
ncbi:MAG: thioredoxin-dependent thiol peroxidase [Gaiellaceae bacterium]